VLSEKLLITRLANSRARARLGQNLTIGFPNGRFIAVVEHELDLADIEPSQLDTEVEIDQNLQLGRKHVPVPSRHFGETVVGNQVGDCSIADKCDKRSAGTVFKPRSFAASIRP
jgi:hypothetical protein